MACVVWFFYPLGSKQVNSGSNKNLPEYSVAVCSIWDCMPDVVPDWSITQTLNSFVNPFILVCYNSYHTLLIFEVVVSTYLPIHPIALVFFKVFVHYRSILYYIDKSQELQCSSINM